MLQYPAFRDRSRRRYAPRGPIMLAYLFAVSQENERNLHISRESPMGNSIRAEVKQRYPAASIARSCHTKPRACSAARRNTIAGTQR